MYSIASLGSGSTVSPKKVADVSSPMPFSNKTRMPYKKNLQTMKTFKKIKCIEFKPNTLQISVMITEYQLNEDIYIMKISRKFFSLYSSKMI